MRIACVYLPSFPLQAHVRRAPHLAGTALAIVEPRPAGSLVLACSRAAWAEGVRPAMPLAVARVRCPGLEAIAADRVLCRNTLQVVIESLLGACDTVDAGSDLEALLPHRAIYVKVPARTRAASFGQKLLAQLSRQGLRARVAIADDRFTAHVAAARGDHGARGSEEDSADSADGLPAQFQPSCLVVPRGGSAAFLAPLPLALLPIDPDIRNLLETCGVTTLGDFAALPPPSVARDRIAPDRDYQALARGHGPSALHGLPAGEVLARLIVERLDLAHAITEYQALAFVLRTLCDRIGQRLHGRDRAACVIELVLLRAPTTLSIATAMDTPDQEHGEIAHLASEDVHGQASDTHGTVMDEALTVSVTLSEPSRSGRELLDAIRATLQTSGLPYPVLAIELRVTAEVASARDEMDLFETARAAMAGGQGACASNEAPDSGAGLATSMGTARPAQPASPRLALRSDGPQQVLRLFE